MSLSEQIKVKALELGYCKAGITSADEFTDYVEELSSRGDEYDWWKKGARKPLEAADPAFWLKDSKSVIVVAYDAFQHSFPENLVGVVGRIYQARCYLSSPDRINGSRRILFEDYLKSKGCTVVSSFFLPARAAAQRSGVASIGKNNFAYVKGVGSFVIIDMFVVDKELDYDQPSRPLKCPDDCTACRDACPTGALSEAYALDPKRCIAYLNWMTQAKFGVDPYIDPKLRSAIGTRVHGCDACQEACPRNQKRLAADLLPDNYLVELSQVFSLEKLLHLENDFYDSYVEPIMYNYIGDRYYFQRNAAIALGNAGDEKAVPDLIQELSHDEPVVRGHVAWALGQINTAEAREALELALAQETDDIVIAEIQGALLASL